MAKRIDIPKKLLIEAYKDNLSPDEMAERFGVSYKVLSTRIKEYNLPKNLIRKKRKIKCDILQKRICDSYQQGMSSNEIAELEHLSPSCILKVLKMNHIERRESFDRLYYLNINENFFEKIDTEEKAYFLGFIYADGYLREKDYTLSFGLQQQDAYMVERLSSLLFPQEKPKFQYGQNFVYFTCSSQINASHLKNLGVFQRKSLTLKFPTETQVPNYLMRHFVRGYFDGDGCISVYKGYKNTVVGTVNIVGSSYFIKFLREKLLKVVKTKISLCQKINSPQTWSLSFSALESIREIYHYLYNDSSIQLNRKKDKFNNLFKIKEEEKSYKYVRNLPNSTLAH